MEDLQELILLEQFKNTLPDRVVTYIQEKQVSRVTDAARLADEFVLTHKVFFGENPGCGDSGSRERIVRANSSNFWSEGTGRFFVKAEQGLRGKLDPNRVCNYGFGKGWLAHWRNECPMLRKKSKPIYFPAKPSAAGVSLLAEERSHVIAAMRAHTKLPSSKSVMRFRFGLKNRQVPQLMRRLTPVMLHLCLMVVFHWSGVRGKYLSRY